MPLLREKELGLCNEKVRRKAKAFRKQRSPAREPTSFPKDGAFSSHEAHSSSANAPFPILMAQRFSEGTTVALPPPLRSAVFAVGSSYALLGVSSGEALALSF